jgi:hypothetical protein
MVHVPSNLLTEKNIAIARYYSLQNGRPFIVYDISLAYSVCMCNRHPFLPSPTSEIPQSEPKEDEPVMNGKQRAKWYADAISDLQRLQKQARGRVDDAPLRTAVEKLREARELALSVGTEPGGDDHGD